MDEKMFKTTLNFLKAHKDEVKESYGSLIIRKIKGGITYKIYFKLVDYEKWDNKPAYMKLIFPQDREVILTPLTELEQEIKTNARFGLAKYEFEETILGSDLLEFESKYLYLLVINGKYFDLTEKMANELTKIFDIQIQDHTKAK